MCDLLLLTAREGDLVSNKNKNNSNGLFTHFKVETELQMGAQKDNII